MNSLQVLKNAETKGWARDNFVYNLKFKQKISFDLETLEQTHCTEIITALLDPRAFLWGSASVLHL